MDTSSADDLVFSRLRSTWQPVALARALGPGQVRACRLLDHDLVVAQLEDGPAAWADGCPHRGARFGLGWSVGGTLVCPYHGWAFDRAGQCRSIPSQGGTCPAANGVRIASYPCVERYGFIWVLLAGPAIAGIPSIPEFSDPAWTYVVAEPTPFATGFRREVENYLDMSHFAFAHRETLGLAAATVIDRYQVESMPDGVRMDAEFPALADGDRPPSKLQQAHHRIQRAWWPNVTTIRQIFPDGDQRVLVHIPAPISATSCIVYWSIAISPGFRGPAPADQLAFAVRVLEEDRRMCENQRPLEVPLIGESARYVSADRFPLAWRQGFAAWIRTEAGANR